MLKNQLIKGVRLSTQAMRPVSTLASTQVESTLRLMRPSQTSGFGVGNTGASFTFSQAASFGRGQTLFSTKALNYTADIGARMNALKEIFKFRNKVTQSSLTGDALVRESEFFCKLIMACSAQNGLCETQRNLCIPYVRMYSGAPVDGSADNPSATAQLGVITKEYPTDKKKSTLAEIRLIGIAIDHLCKSEDESSILKRSALYIAVQLISLDKPFSKADKEWIVGVAKSLNISEQEEQALTALSVLDQTYTPFGPKPTLTKDVYERVVRELDTIKQQMNSLYLPESQFSMS